MAAGQTPELDSRPQSRREWSGWLGSLVLPLAVLAVIFGALFSFAITRDGSVVTPVGEGTIVLDAGTFEAFPLPDYAAKHVTKDYKSYFVEVEPGIKIHVLEVGSGFPVFLMHGNPTSGFLYRKVAAELPTDRLRVIMPTLAGLGFSSKIPASQHTLENHMRWLNGVLVQLELKELVFAGQDWGGPTGMGALALSPGLLKGVVPMNTMFNAPTEKAELTRAHTIVKTPVVGEILTGVIGSVFDALPRVQNDASTMPPEIVELYAKPVRESGNVKAPLAQMRMVPDGPDHPSSEQLRFIEDYVQGLDVPAELVWGINDPILGKGVAAMAENFPDAPIIETEAGHFLQEEVPDEIAAALLRVVTKVQAVDDGPEEE
jgi:pimeloyl-ACP methyl ester carboxylesterase